MPSSGNSAAKRAAPAHLERAVDPRDRLADQAVLLRGSADRACRRASSCRAPAGPPSASRPATAPCTACLASSTMLMLPLPPGRRARRRSSACASSILKPLSRSGCASASSASAAARKAASVAGLAAQRRLRLRRAPRLVRDAAEREPHVRDPAVLAPRAPPRPRPARRRSSPGRAPCDRSSAPRTAARGSSIAVISSPGSSTVSISG